MHKQFNELVDRQKIIDVGLRLAKAGDTRDRKLLRTCFTPDGIVSMPSLGQFVGIDALESSMANLEKLDVTQHVITNQSVHIVGETATMESYVTATHIKYDHPDGAVFTAGGDYLDDFVLSNGGWLIARRIARVLWTTGNVAMVFSVDPVRR